jgi:hypothetical protein
MKRDNKGGGGGGEEEEEEDAADGRVDVIGWLYTFVFEIYR